MLVLAPQRAACLCLFVLFFLSDRSPGQFKGFKLVCPRRNRRMCWPTPVSCLRWSTAVCATDACHVPCREMHKSPRSPPPSETAYPLCRRRKPGSQSPTQLGVVCSASGDGDKNWTASGSRPVTWRSAFAWPPAAVWLCQQHEDNHQRAVARTPVLLLTRCCWEHRQQQQL